MGGWAVLLLELLISNSPHRYVYNQSTRAIRTTKSFFVYQISFVVTLRKLPETLLLKSIETSDMAGHGRGFNGVGGMVGNGIGRQGIVGRGIGGRREIGGRGIGGQVMAAAQGMAVQGENIGDIQVVEQVHRDPETIQRRLSLCTTYLGEVDDYVRGLKRKKPTLHMQEIMTRCVRMYTNFAEDYELRVRTAAEAERFLLRVGNAMDATGSTKHRPKKLLKKLHEITGSYFRALQALHTTVTDEFHAAQEAQASIRPNPGRHPNRGRGAHR